MKHPSEHQTRGGCMQKKTKPHCCLKLTPFVPVPASTFSQQNSNAKGWEDLSAIYPFISCIMQLAVGLSNVFNSSGGDPGSQRN